jgi:hypothetical protein
MDAETQPTSMLDAAVLRLLRPLARLLLRHAVPFSAFQELAKRAYVAAALADFTIPGKKPSVSRASILTGLTRKDVQRLVAEPDPSVGISSERYNRAARVLTGWVRDPDFQDADGQPRGLDADGEFGFAALVKRYSGDMPARAMLDELLRVGAVQRLEDGRIEPLTRAYVPHHSAADKLVILGADVSDLIDTIDHNMLHGSIDPRFQRKVMYHHVPVEALPAFRKLSAAQAQALLEKLDIWLADQCAEPSRDDVKAPSARAGLGIFYFEERQAPSAARKGTP